MSALREMLFPQWRRNCGTQDHHGSGDQILACAKALAASAIPRLLEEAQAMQRELEARRQVLSLLADHYANGAGYGDAANEYLASLNKPASGRVIIQPPSHG